MFREQSLSCAVLGLELRDEGLGSRGKRAGLGLCGSGCRGQQHMALEGFHEVVIHEEVHSGEGMGVPLEA